MCSELHFPATLVRLVLPLTLFFINTFNDVSLMAS